MASTITPEHAKDTDRYPNLETVVARQQWPTPRTQMTRPVKLREGGHRGNLEEVVAEVENWPTPSSRDWKGGRSFEALKASGRNENNNLNDKVNAAEGQPSALNADWVEALMGWPIGWSDLEPIENIEWDATWSQWEPDIPRVTTGQKDRAKRLKAIGNGQVPLTVATAYQTLTNQEG